MTPSAPVRALVTVFDWLFPKRYRAFDPEDFDGALEFLGVPTAEHARYRGAVKELRARLGA